VSRPRRLVPISLTALTALSLTACTALGPDYARPELPLPEAYSAAAPAEAALPDRWWSLFADPVLDRLVTEALGANQDLAEAAARVEEARALAGIARADRYPEITGTVNGSRTRLSKETLNLPPEVVIPLEIDRYRAAANLSYELDFWGRLRRLAEAARAELLHGAGTQFDPQVVQAFLSALGAPAVPARAAA
jgi:outer membrane protein TolC